VIATREQKASWLIAAVVLVAVIELHLLSALLAGMLVYELVHVGASALERHVANQRAKLITVGLLAVAVVTLLVVAGFALGSFLRDENSLAALANKMAEILENSRRSLPEWALAALPDTIEGIRDSAVAWLREHAKEMQVVGKDAAVTAAHVLVGIVIGAMVALRHASAANTEKPFAAALGERCHRFAEAFRRIVFAQVRISALNTVFTAIYLLAVLPMFGIHLPFAKTMVVVTFIAGLLPVIGNLVSNTVIVIVSLAHSPQTAMGSLAFLVIIHKLEYFLNARIVGSRIQAQAWELLVAMLAMEAAFGLPGIVAAPIYYAYLKQELVDAGQV
jgi:predicted PurR-regulated permease PerM